MRTLGPCARRVGVACLTAGMYVVLASFAPRPDVPGPTGVTTPGADPVAVLRAGNRRFVQRVQTALPITAADRAVTPAQGAPAAAVLSCAESRLPAEYVFDAAPGELVVVRSLGAIVDKAVVASLEYGVETLHAPLLVVMGHDACAAVRLGSAPAPVSDSLAFVAKAIRDGRRAAGESADVRTVVLANVEHVINDIVEASPLLRTAAESGRVQIVGAYFDSTSGIVAFSDPVALAAHGSAPHQ